MIITVQNHLVCGIKFLVGKSVLSAWHDGINRKLGNQSLAMGMKPSLLSFCLLWSSPNSLVARFLFINVFLSVRGESLTVIMFPTIILLHHGKVPCVVVLISQRSSKFSDFPSTKFPLDPFATGQY
jgi:hypothetical protein